MGHEFAWRRKGISQRDSPGTTPLKVDILYVYRKGQEGRTSNVTEIRRGPNDGTFTADPSLLSDGIKENWTRV